MTLAARFLGGAKSRLLPVSVPFRFFTTAVCFHVIAWFVLVITAEDLPAFTGGPGMVLAALHLLTLGVLVMTAMGAAFQLLPVATRRPLLRVWPARLCYWLLMPGTLILAYGMASGHASAMHAGGAAVVLALAVFAIIIGDNLRRVGDLPVVGAHGWAALASLAGFAALGLLLVANYAKGVLPDHQAAGLAHMILAGFGFMGLLALGFSHVLIPMFSLSPVLPPRPSWTGFWLAAGAVLLAAVAAIARQPALLAMSSVMGLCAGGVYLWLMYWALKTGMRKRLGLSFFLIKLSWGGLVLSLLTGVALAFGIPIPNGMTLFGFLLIAGWLATFLTGILQRIMPFLGSMHGKDASGRPMTPAKLTAEIPLKIHAVCHVAAVVLCAAAIVADLGALARAGAVFGLIGAVAFAGFALRLVTKLV